MSKSYTKWKRLLSLILAFSMVMGGMSLTSYATGTIDDPVKSVSTAADDPSALHITKSVSDMNEDGTYDLTLEAYATGTSTVTTTHKPVDFILVLDVSGSMDESITTKTASTYEARKSAGYSYRDIKDGSYYYKDGNEYYKVNAGGGYGSRNIYYTANDTTYYLNGTSVTTVAPTGRGKDTTQWTGVLYTLETTSTTAKKMVLLKNAVNGFIDYVAKDAVDYDVEHRISLVKFAMGSSDNIGNDFDRDGYNKSQIVKSFTTASTGSAELKSAVTDLKAAGATQVDYGLAHANTLLSNSSDKPDSDKIVIVFTDGSPTSYNSFENGVANAAVRQAHNLKAAGAKVYTIGAFSGNSNTNEENFINVISSNYPDSNGDCFSGNNHSLNTQNAGLKADNKYSSLVTADNGFDSIFTNIAESSIGTVAQADETSELVDKLSGYVDFAGTLEDTIVKTVKMTENGWSTTKLDAPEGTEVEYDTEEKLISVTGFDYISDENVVIDNVQGTKLVVTFKIKVDPDADWQEGKNLVPTNAEDFALISKTEEDGTTTTNLIKLTESPEIVVNAYSVTYSWTGLPEGQTAAVVPAKAVYIPGVDVKADTTFKKDDVVTVNGLKYEFSGWDETEDFTMPSKNVEIKGTWKEAVRDYTINYYQQGTATKGDLANYTLVSADTQKGTATAGSTVSAPEGYADKYADNNYVFEKADPASITVDLDSTKNVINIYYAREATKATFVRNYTLTTISEDGTSTTAKPVTVSETKDLQVGDTFAKVASEYTSFGGVTYEFKSDESSAASIVAETDAEKNVINFYYEAEIDNRKPATVTVYHVYTLHDKKVENGDYVERDIATDPIEVEGPAKKKATETYTATTLQPIEGYEGYAYSDGNNETITLAPGENKIVLYFEKDAQEPEKATFTVEHYYTTITVTVDENGEKSEKTETPDPTTVSVEKHVGESFTPIEVPNGFTSDPENANKLRNPYIVGSDPEKNVVELHYFKRVEPAKADVTVNHYYYDITETTVPVTDENGVVIGTEVKETVAQNGDPVTATISGKYVGESYTVDKVAREGYTFMEKYGDYSSDPLSGRVAENGNTVNLYYFSTSKVDDRDGADISVKHSYVAQVTKVVNTFDEKGALVSSELATVYEPEGEFVEEFKGLKAGDKFTPKSEPKYNNYEYVVVKEPGEIVIQAGTNDTVNIQYVRPDVVDYTGTSYTVNYVYKTKKMVIGADGKAAYEWVTEKVEGHDAVKGTGYVGQYVTIDFGADSSYPFVDGQAPATLQQLVENGNEWTFTYYRVEDLSTVKVTVKHQYHTTVIGVNGEKTTTDEYNEKNDVVTTPYAGENASAAPAPNGFPEKENGGYDFTVTEGVDYTLNNDGSLSFTAGSDVTVVFDYYKTIDNSVSAEYTVKNVYEVYDWNGKLVDTETVDGRGGSSFATVSVSVEPTAKDQYELVSAKFNGEPLEYENGYKITLEGGEKTNEVVFTFKHTLERPDVSYTVIHEYYVNGRFEGSREENKSGKLDDVISASSIDKETSFRDVEYQFSGSDVESITLESVDGKYVITMTYVYDTYNYGLFYNGNGGADADGSTRLADAENVEDTEETAWTFAVDGGRFSRANYRFAGWATTSDGEAVYKEGDAITLSMKDQLVSENDPRTFGLELFAVWEYVGGNTRPRNPEPETPVEPEEPEDIEEPEVPLTEEPEITEEFEDVTEPEVPLAEAPEEFEDLLEDEVPLAAVPATGDRAIIWFVLSIMAALGLAVLTIEEKKARKF